MGNIFTTITHKSLYHILQFVVASRYFIHSANRAQFESLDLLG